MNRFAYIARYPLNQQGNGLVEEILVKDTHCTRKLDDEWDRLVKEREPNWKTAPMLQYWYSDKYQVECMAATNQPFKLD